MIMNYTQSSIESALNILYEPNVPSKERNRADNYLQAFQRGGSTNSDEYQIAWNISMNLLLQTTTNNVSQPQKNQEVVQYFAAQCLYEIGVKNNGRNDTKNKQMLLKDVWNILLYCCGHYKQLLHVHKKLTLTFIGLYAQIEDPDQSVPLKYSILDILESLQSDSTTTTPNDNANTSTILYATIIILSLYIEELYNSRLAVCKSKRYKLQQQANTITMNVLHKLHEYYNHKSTTTVVKMDVILFQAFKNWLQHCPQLPDHQFILSSNIIQESMKVIDHEDQAFQLIQVLIQKLETASSEAVTAASITTAVDENNIVIVTTWIIEELLKQSNWKTSEKVVILLCDIFQCTFPSIKQQQQQPQLQQVLNRIGDILQHTKLSIAQYTFPCWVLYFQIQTQSNDPYHVNIRNNFFHVLLQRTQYPIQVLEASSQEEWEDFREEMRQCCRDILQNDYNNNNNDKENTIASFLINELSTQLYHQLAPSSSSTSWNAIESYLHACSAIAKYIPLQHDPHSNFLTWLFTTIPQCNQYKTIPPVYKSISTFISVLIDWIKYDYQQQNYQATTSRLSLVIPILFQALTFPDTDNSSIYCSMKLKQDHVAIVALFKLFREDELKGHIQEDWKLHLLHLYQFNYPQDHQQQVLLEQPSHELLLRALLQVPSIDIVQQIVHSLFVVLLQQSKATTDEEEATSIDLSILFKHWKIASECSYNNMIIQFMEMHWSSSFKSLFQHYYNNNSNSINYAVLLNEFLISLFMHHKNNGLGLIQVSLPFFQTMVQSSSTTSSILSILRAMAYALPVENINDFHLILQDIIQRNWQDVKFVPALTLFFIEMGEHNPMYILHTNTIDLMIHFIDLCADENIPSKFQLLQTLCSWYKENTTLSQHLHPFILQHAPKWISFILITMRNAQHQHVSINTFLIFLKVAVIVDKQQSNNLVLLWVDACFQEYPTFPRTTTSMEEKLLFKNQLIDANGAERKIRRILRSFVGRC